MRTTERESKKNELAIAIRSMQRKANIEPAPMRLLVDLNIDTLQAVLRLATEDANNPNLDAMRSRALL